MSKKMSQNIFDYATSELSQDAFISLIIGWSDNDDPKLRKLSKSFIQVLYKKYQLDIMNNNSTIDFERNAVELKQQHYKIDVYFEVKTDKKTVPFIIEDKTWTEPHSKQLSRYAEAISKSKKLPTEDIVKVFFKTGHITEKDRGEANRSKYMILDTKWIYNFLMTYNIDNEIFKSYIDFLKRNFYDKLYKNNTKKQLEDWTYKDVNNGYVQYAILEKIKHLILGSDKPTAEYIKFTRNGKRWDTWWTCYRSTDFSIFVKIKQLKEGHCIRLIEFSNKDFKEKDKKSKIEYKKDSLDKNIKLAKQILETLPNCNIRENKNPRYKARESEISILNLKDVDSLEIAVYDFSNFLKKFIDKF